MLNPQGIPRTILFDHKTGSNLLQWPVEEVNKLRSNKTVFENLEINAGAVVPLDIGLGTQVCTVHVIGIIGKYCWTISYYIG